MIKVEVIFMLHNEARHLIVQALNHHIPVKEIAKCFSVNTSTIYRLREQLSSNRLCGNAYLPARP